MSWHLRGYLIPNHPKDYAMLFLVNRMFGLKTDNLYFLLAKIIVLSLHLAHFHYLE